MTAQEEILINFHFFGGMDGGVIGTFIAPESVVTEAENDDTF